MYHLQVNRFCHDSNLNLDGLAHLIMIPLVFLFSGYVLHPFQPQILHSIRYAFTSVRFISRQVFAINSLLSADDA